MSSSSLSILLPEAQASQTLPSDVIGVNFSPRTAKDDIFTFIKRVTGAERDDPRVNPRARELYVKILGNANEYKEGDETIGVAAPNEECRLAARELIANTKVEDMDRYPLNRDYLYELCQEVDPQSVALTAEWTIGQLKRFILDEEDETKVRAIMPGLTSDVIACLVKLMSNAELIKLGSKIFNPLPGSKLGAKGYFGARVQPNSPTDDPEDIFWQCLNAFSFAVGDVMLGTNPVSSDPDSVYAVEKMLKEVVDTFGIQDVLPHCVLAHIDIQAQVEKKHPGSTALWFQSIAGSDAANQTFDLPVQKMLDHALTRSGKYGLYLETGQGADFTNGHAKGIDMIIHDSRKYGFARALRKRVGDAQERAGKERAARIYINDVAGFIGPEVFRTKEQLVRVCLEDIAMGKLHGLTIGLDVCSTLHMDVSLDDLDWCLDNILPANPSWAMALPTKNDPMLSYLTTAFQDHVRLRNKFGYKVDDAMWDFFAHDLQVVDARTGAPTEHFGDPMWVYLKFARKRGDARPDADILREAERRVKAVQAKGVPIAVKHGAKPWDLNAELDKEIRRLYLDAKTTLWNEYSPEFLATIPSAVHLKTLSNSRQDYVFHPETGERLHEESIQLLVSHLRSGTHNVAIVISDGLCADAIMDNGHLTPFLANLRDMLGKQDQVFSIMSNNLVVKSGRVRAGYHIGEILFGVTRDDVARDGEDIWDAPCGVVHIIGERPGSGHHTFSAYLTVATRRTWSKTRAVDHDITRVVSGIADTSYDPLKASRESATIFAGQFASVKNVPPPAVSPSNATFSRPQKLLRLDSDLSTS